MNSVVSFKVVQIYVQLQVGLCAFGIWMDAVAYLGMLFLVADRTLPPAPWLTAEALAAELAMALLRAVGGPDRRATALGDNLVVPGTEGVQVLFLAPNYEKCML